MKKILFFITASMLYVAMAACPVVTKTGETRDRDILSRIISTPADRILKKDGWELKVWITGKGSRSQGEYSILTHNGEEVCPQKKDEILITPIGIMKYIDSHLVWGWHGWYPEKTDPSLKGCRYEYLKGEGKELERKEAWVYKVWTTAEGTRSEGKYGRLFHNGKEVCPKIGQVILFTPLGEFSFVDNHRKWGWHGWKHGMIHKRLR